mmetsp:Transcript_28442/g.91549  ORF Transcript_28442/g.91549 Transcript_28442/m.91549 type:complete len:247 (+) Transcript_28442:1359-2099(+)
MRFQHTRAGLCGEQLWHFRRGRGGSVPGVRRVCHHHLDQHDGHVLDDLPHLNFDIHCDQHHHHRHHHIFHGHVDLARYIDCRCGGDRHVLDDLPHLNFDIHCDQHHHHRHHHIFHGHGDLDRYIEWRCGGDRCHEYQTRRLPGARQGATAGLSSCRWVPSQPTHHLHRRLPVHLHVAIQKVKQLHLRQAQCLWNIAKGQHFLLLYERRRRWGLSRALRQFERGVRRETTGVGLYWDLRWRRQLYLD